MKLYVNQNPEYPTKRHLRLGDKSVETESQEEARTLTKCFSKMSLTKKPKEKAFLVPEIRKETRVDSPDNSSEDVEYTSHESAKSSEVAEDTSLNMEDSNSIEVDLASDREFTTDIEHEESNKKKIGLNLGPKSKKDIPADVSISETVTTSNTNISMVALATLILCFALSLALGFFSGEAIFKFIIDRGLFR